MKITAFQENRGVDLSTGPAINVYQLGPGATAFALGSNTPLPDSGAGDPGDGPQASAWDHVHPEGSASGSNSMTRTLGGQAAVVARGSIGSAATLDLGGGNYFTATLTANATIAFAHWPTSGSLAEIGVRVTEDGTGGWTPTFSGVTWIGGTTPTHVTTAGTSTEYVFWSADGGATILGGQVGAGGGSSLTIKDEGTPLATAATSIDFVGAGVTASGTGAAKTVTVPGTTSSDVSTMGFRGELLISSTPSNPIVFGDVMLKSDGTDFVYATIP